jgi:branched-chain amino acid transport system ATP-binding protein
VATLEVSGLGCSYGRARVLDGVDFTVQDGEIVTLIGPNGAGKTTLLNVVSRALALREGKVILDGHDTGGASQAQMVRQGCLLVPEGRQVFTSLTVEDNLKLGRYVHRRESGLSGELAHVYDLFPRLEERARQLAGTLSGGEQQMLAIGRAMMGRPRLMLLDEPSLGLAPLLVQRIMEALARLREEGLTILLVEQNAHAALQLADRGYLLHTGKVLASGTSKQLADDPAVRHVYLGGQPSADPIDPTELSTARMTQS